MKNWIVALALAAPMANAALITIEPDDYEAGVDVSNAVPGVRIVNVYRPQGGVEEDRAVFVEEAMGCPGPACRASTGSKHFGWYGGGYAYDSEYVDDLYDLLAFRFDNTVFDLTVHLTFGGDAAWLIGDCHIGWVSGTYGRCDAEIEIVWVEQEGIGEHHRLATVKLDSADSLLLGGQSGYITVDAISFRTEPLLADVPTPSTLALLGLGLAGLAMRRR